MNDKTVRLKLEPDRRGFETEKTREALEELCVPPEERAPSSTAGEPVGGRSTQVKASQGRSSLKSLCKGRPASGIKNVDTNTEDGAVRLETHCPAGHTMLPTFMHRVKFAKFMGPLFLVALTACAHHDASHPVAGPVPVAAGPTAPTAAVAVGVRAEQIRPGCIAGRRLVCGKVLKVLPDGLVVDSGYLDVLRPPLTQSWVIPGAVTAHRDPAAIELKEPGTPCIGLVFLTDTPKRPKARVFDYVVLMGYPAGSHGYTPAPGVEKTLRRFSAGLDTAVRLQLQAGENGLAAPAGRDSH